MSVFQIELTDQQVNEIVCGELARLIKVELDRKKDGGFCDEDLVITSLKMLKRYLSPNEYNTLLDVVNAYNAK